MKNEPKGMWNAILTTGSLLGCTVKPFVIKRLNLFGKSYGLILLKRVSGVRETYTNWQTFRLEQKASTDFSEWKIKDPAR